MMRKQTRFVLVGLVAAALAGAAPHVGAQGNGPRTTSVTGTFTGDPVNAKQRVCVGQDGPYLEIRGQFSGAISSSDPRLTGTLDFSSEPALVNLTTGLGTFRGRFQITNSTTGMQTAQGQFFTVVTEGRLNHGFALGTLVNNGGGATDDLFATIQSTFDAALHVNGVFGITTAGDPRLPAVVQGGHCDGPFTQVP
jgi:hypothetical protein